MHERVDGAWSPGRRGLLGSHIAERLVGGRAGPGPGADPASGHAFLESLGVEIVRGDLTDPPRAPGPSGGSDAVYHSAAKVGDWGPWREFQAGCIDATRNLAEASASAGVRPVPPHQLDERLRPSAGAGPSRSTRRPRSGRTSGSGTTTRGARSSASGSSGDWPRREGSP